jgi:hypothetical protein
MSFISSMFRFLMVKSIPPFRWVSTTLLEGEVCCSLCAKVPQNCSEWAPWLPIW